MTVADLRATEPERPGGYDNVIGPRARFGVIAPSTNTTVEADLWAVRPPGVSFHTGRMHIPSPMIRSDADFEALIGQIRASIDTAVRDVMTCFPTYMLMGMSAEAFWGGVEGNAGFIRRIEERTGLGVSTGASACRAALEHFGAHASRCSPPTSRSRIDRWATTAADPEQHRAEVTRSAMLDAIRSSL